MIMTHRESIRPLKFPEYDNCLGSNRPGRWWTQCLARLWLWLCNTICQWDATECNWPMQYVAKIGGYKKIVQLCITWGATDLNGVMLYAASGGYIDIVQQCKEWGATDFNWAMLSAARGGYIEIVRLCREWGATEFDGAMRNAACSGHIEIVRLCKEWGATDIVKTLRYAAYGGHTEIMKLCKKWGANNLYTAMLETKCIEARILLRNWIEYNEDYKSLAQHHQRRLYEKLLQNDLRPAAWHPNRALEWCFDEEDKALIYSYT